MAAAAEGGLLLLALALGWWWDTPPFGRLELNLRGLAAGIAATAPLLVGLHWCLHTRWPPVARLVRTVEEQIGPLFVGAHPSDLVLVALAAGVGEEALFRGVLQTTLDGRLPAAAAIVAVGLLFGAAHWVTAIYAVVAALVGVYLGTLFHLSGNLLAPMTAHALYDIVALSILARVKPAPPGSVV